MSDETKWINARQVYVRYGIPRNLLRELARNGKVKTRSVSVRPTGKIMKLYSSDDCASVVG